MCRSLTDEDHGGSLEVFVASPDCGRTFPQLLHCLLKEVLLSCQPRTRRPQLPLFDCLTGTGETTGPPSVPDVHFIECNVLSILQFI